MVKKLSVAVEICFESKHVTETDIPWSQVPASLSPLAAKPMKAQWNLIILHIIAETSYGP